MRTKKLTLEEHMPLRHDISHNCELKAVIEQLFGKEAWLDLKECTHLPTWRTYVIKIINALDISIQESIEIRDEEWIRQINENLERGKKSAKSAKCFEELLSGFTATLLRQIFIHIGLLPQRATSTKVTLSRENWRLNTQRSVQYIQSKPQIENAFWSEQQGRIGFQKQMELHNEHRRSKSKLPFSKWCKERGA